ncbi:unnamed protein product [Parnassius mnemosyne]|uniref:Uncharacterized protein n=1 Tax=Parnassius mnemosyne TaxID=213953 RepID=A0AAV1KXU5_9NEOP
MHGRIRRIKVAAYLRPTGGHRPPLISERVLGQGNVRRAAPMRVGELHMSSKYFSFLFLRHAGFLTMFSFTAEHVVNQHLKLQLTISLVPAGIEHGLLEYCEAYSER